MSFIEIIKKGIKEFIKTFSQNKSFLSSKKLERFSFIALSLSIVTGTFIYLVVAKTLIATDAVVLITPLLIAAGYNMLQTEKEKQLNKGENDNN